MKFKKAIEHSINIYPSHNGGFTVSVGCATIVYGNLEKKDMLSDLAEFLSEPEKVEKEYNLSLSGPQDTSQQPTVPEVRSWPLEAAQPMTSGPSRSSSS